MDPDHPLAALVRKAKEERNGTASAAMATPPEEVVPDPTPSSTPAQYTADREYTLALMGPSSTHFSSDPLHFVPILFNISFSFPLTQGDQNLFFYH